MARASVSTQRLPLLQRREAETTSRSSPLTGDRGLAGAFNAQVVRRAFALGRELEAEGQTVRWLVVGQEGPLDAALPRLRRRQRLDGLHRPAGLHRRAGDRAHAWPSCTSPARSTASIIVYNHFESPLVQKVAEQEVLPIPEHLLETDDEERRDDALRGDFIYEPEPEEILARLLPVYLETELYRALLESAASEQGARMTAMRNASKNAGELIDSLTLAMNRARQAEITQEILEVVAGADALEG